MQTLERMLKEGLTLQIMSRTDPTERKEQESYLCNER